MSREEEDCNAADEHTNIICCICNKVCSPSLKLSAETNQRLRTNIESCLEQLLDHDASICYYCRNTFEESFNSVAIYRNKYDFVQRGLREDAGYCEADGSSCDLCGQNYYKNINQLTNLNKHVKLKNIIKFRLHDDLEKGNPELICFNCHRLLIKLEWMESEVIKIKLLFQEHFELESISKDRQYLMSTGLDSFTDTNRIIFHVVNVKKSHDIILELDTNNTLPQVHNESFISVHVIEELILNQYEADQCLMTHNGSIYLSYDTMKQLGVHIRFDNSKLYVILSSEDNVTEKSSLTCASCTFSSNYLYFLAQHYKTEHQAANKNVIQRKEDIGAMIMSSLVLYKCTFCQEQFDRKSDFKSHNVVCKSGLPTLASVECHLCSKLFRSQDSLRVHVLRDHEGSKTPWTCSICDKGFTRKASYEEHINRHKGIKERKCEKCNKHFYETAYWRHMKTVHADVDTFKYSCNICTKQFSHRFKLKQHMVIHTPAGEKRIPCQFKECKKNFATDEKLRAHVKSVHQTKFSSPLVCGECGATYSKYSSICSHQRNCHALHSQKLRPLPCSECPQTFGSAAALNKHVTIRHKNHTEKSYICEVDNCESSFWDLSSLEHHEKESHDITTITVNRVDDETDALDSFDDGINVIKLDSVDSSVTILNDETLFFNQEADIRIVSELEENHDEDHFIGQNDKNNEEQQVQPNLLLNMKAQPDHIKTQSQQNNLMHDSIKLESPAKEQNSNQKGTVFQLPAVTVTIDPNSKSKPSSYQSKIQLESVLLANKAKESLLKIVPDGNHSTDELVNKITDISDITVMNEMTLYNDVEREIAEHEDDCEVSVEGCSDIIINPIVTDVANINFPISKMILNSEGDGNACELDVNNEGIVYSVDDESVISKFDDVSSRYQTNCQDFPPLPNYLPDTLLDDGMEEMMDGETCELDKCVQLKFASQTEYNVVFTNTDSSSILIDSDNNDKNTRTNEMWQCSDCQNSFSDKTSLDSHACKKNRSILNKSISKKMIKSLILNQFECDLCHKKFTSKKILKRHYRVHTGEKPYSCEFCNKTFAAASNLSEHRTLHTGRMAYSCNNCGNKFRLWSSLNRHKKKCTITES